MFAAIKSGAASTAAPADPYFYDVPLLLSGDGTNGAQNNTFLDSSTNNFTITRNGNTTQGSFSPYTSTGSSWSNYCASNGYLTTPGNSVFNLTGDFTIEAWVYLTTYTGNAYNELMVWECRSGAGTGANFYISNTASGKAGAIGFWINGSAIEYATAGTVPLNAWTHVAVSRSGSGSNNIKIFVNGTQVVQGTNTATVGDATTTNYVAGSSYGQGLMNYISNFRLTKGGALYTTTFTPSTTPLTTTVSSGTVSLLTCQSNRFIDNSSNALALTSTNSPSVQRFNPFNPNAAYSTSVVGGSGYFDGSGDYLNASQSAFVATGDFTIEAWFYQINQTSGYQGIVSTAAAGGSTGFRITTDNNTLTMWLNNSSVTSASVPQNQWNHVAISRTGTGSNNVSFYLNGTRIGQITNTSSTTNSSLVIGQYYYDTANYYINGYISNVRLISGSGGGIYSGTTITVPTAPLTAVTNTQLLTSMTNAGIYDSAMMNDLETVGNAQISTSVKKYGTGSMAFDGTGDYLSCPAFNAGMNPQSGNFTVEFWVYIASLPGAEQAIFSTFTAGGSGILIGLGGGGNVNKMQFAIGNLSVGNPTVVDTVNFTTGSWVHIAAVRNSGTLYLYKNGTSIGTPTSASGTLNQSVLTVGAWNGGGAPFNGYIDDLRISTFARYTSNFTAPTAALPNY